jgi:hypothetical protein
MGSSETRCIWLRRLLLPCLALRLPGHLQIDPSYGPCRGRIAKQREPDAGSCIARHVVFQTAGNSFIDPPNNRTPQSEILVIDIFTVRNLRGKQKESKSRYFYGSFLPLPVDLNRSLWGPGYRVFAPRCVWETLGWVRRRFGLWCTEVRALIAESPPRKCHRAEKIWAIRPPSL